MTSYIAVVIIAILILALGERLPNETKTTYINEGYDWKNVLIISNVAAFISGIIAIYLIKKYNMPDFYNPILIPGAVTITSYIAVQSLMTDLRTFLINRNILRVSYITMYIASIYNVLSSEEFYYNWIALVIFTVLLILLFIFSSIGASDIRAIAVALPYTMSIGGYDIIIVFAGTLLALALFMMSRNWWLTRKDYLKYKEDNEVYYSSRPSLRPSENSFSELYSNISDRLMAYMIAKQSIKADYKDSERGTLAVGPFMVLPFLVYLLILPIIS